ncbi:MAG: hypothetical protein U5K84_10025 [Alkalibacterium sp.]|nr:hypothetical protein [Alkalibacterium sp.]
MERFQRMVQQFLNKHGDEFASPEEAVDFFTRMLNDGPMEDNSFSESEMETKETRSMNKLEEAQSVSSLKRRKNLSGKQ